MRLLFEDYDKKCPTAAAKKQLMSFASIHLVEYTYSVGTDLLQRSKKNKLEITKCGNLRLKLIKLEPRNNRICSHHQAQSSHYFVEKF